MKVLLIGNRSCFQSRLRKLLNGLGGGLMFSEAPDFCEAATLGDGGDMVGLICIDLDSVRHRGLHDLLRLQTTYPGVPIAMFDNGQARAGNAGTIASHLLDDSPSSDAQRSVLTSLGEMLGIRVDGPADAGACRDPRLLRLTEREREVLHHLMSGMSNKAIARLLDLQEVTVKAHLRQVFRKLGVTNRTQATALALSIYGSSAAAAAPSEARVASETDRPRLPAVVPPRKVAASAYAHAA